MRNDYDQHFFFGALCIRRDHDTAWDGSSTLLLMGRCMKSQGGRKMYRLHCSAGGPKFG
jgi:hypothetical protein